jgi:MFS family permease
MQSPDTFRRRLKDFMGDLRGPALWVVFGCLVCQIGLGYGYVLGPMAGDVIGELGWTRAMYSGARAPQLIVASLTSPLLGWLVVRQGSRRILLGSIVVLAVAFLLLARMQSLWQLYALVMLQGLAVTGLGDITVGQLTSEWVKRGRGLALGLVYTGSNIGGYLMVALAGWVSAAWSWREAFSVMGVGALVIMLPIAWWTARRPDAPIELEHIEVSQAPAADGAVEDASDQAAAEPPSLGGNEAMRTRSFWILAFSLFTFFFYFLGMLEHLVLFLTDEGMPRSDAFGYFRTALALGIVSKVGLGAIADRIPHERAVQLDFALLATSSLLLLLLPSSVWIWPFIVSYGFATAARDVVYPLVITRCFGLTHMAEIYGLLMLSLLAGGTTGPVFAGALHDHFGSYDLAFATFAVLNVLSAGLLLFVRDERAARAALAPAASNQAR